MKICKVKDCNNKHYAKGFCQSHYRRGKEGKSLILTTPKPNKPKDYQYCHTDNCNGKYYAKGYCLNHYNIMRYDNKMSKCKAYEYCGNYTLHGYCGKHKDRIKKNQSLDLTINYTVGINNIHWRGGVSNYKDHHTFKKHRLIKLKEANYTCYDCGGEAKIVHHLDKTKDNHQLDNLRALCQKCHIRIYHKDTIGRPRKIKNL
jgi:hypothetical protein